MRVFQGLLLWTSATLFLGGCQTVEVHGESAAVAESHPVALSTTPHAMPSHDHLAMVPTMAVGRGGDLTTIIPALSQQRVVYVGETHDRYEHHLSQLTVIDGLHQLEVDFAIGLEFVQRPFQPALDDYIAGRIDEAELLLRTEWYDRWRYDFRLYRQIFEYAREHQIPLVALNLSRELVGKVSAKGIDGLTTEERAQLPAEIDQSDNFYRSRLKEVYDRHPRGTGNDFARFVQVQFAWDETMAERIADHLKQNPQQSMVVLAGSGHLVYGAGIPKRVARRIPVDSAIVLPGSGVRVTPGIADYLIYPPPRELPKSGVMGIMMQRGDQGVVVGQVVEGSAAELQGIRKGDLIQQLEGRPVNSPTDIRIAMLDKGPGDRVTLGVLRRRLVLGDQQFGIELQLQ